MRLVCLDAVASQDRSRGGKGEGTSYRINWTHHTQILWWVDPLTSHDFTPTDTETKNNPRLRGDVATAASHPTTEILPDKDPKLNQSLGPRRGSPGRHGECGRVDGALVNSHSACYPLMTFSLSCQCHSKTGALRVPGTPA